MRHKKEKEIARQKEIYLEISVLLLFLTILILTLSIIEYFPQCMNNQEKHTRFDVRIFNEDTHDECLCACDANFSLDRNAFIYESNQKGR